ncbi:MAG: hypothetical protein WKG03_03685 [Telluria sp.]
MARTEEQKEKHREYMRDWSRRNADKVSARNRAKRLSDPEAERLRVRAYYQANKAVLQEQQASYRKANEVAIRARTRAMREANMAKSLLGYARSRAKRYGYAFNIDVSDCEVPTHCPVLGFELKVAVGKPSANSPTLDRLKPELGYVKGNVMVISHMANTIKSSATVDQLKQVANFYDCIFAAKALK